MLKLVDTSQKSNILGLFIFDKVARLRALPDPPPPQDGVSEFTGRYPLDKGYGEYEAYCCHQILLTRSQQSTDVILLSEVQEMTECK